jgi:uncharacterized protein (TIGR03382 family)
MRFPSYGAAGVLSLCLLSTSAFANSNGISGYSGKTASLTCNSCHTGGTAPTVELTGPTTLAAGATGQYALTIRGGAAVVGGTNIAVSNTAASLEPGAGMKKLGSEITHTSPKSFASGEVRFDFSVVAPASGGTLTLFGAGNSANNSTADRGDMAATTRLDVTITGGSGGGTDGGTSGPDAGPGTDPGDGDDNTGFCSATGGSPLLVFSLLVAGMTLLRRRRD